MYAENLKKIRKELGLTVQQLSEKIDVSANTLSAYERGIRCPSMDFGIQLYEKLNINLNWFIMNKGLMFNGAGAPDELDLRIEEVLKKRGII